MFRTVLRSFIIALFAFVAIAACGSKSTSGGRCGGCAAGQACDPLGVCRVTCNVSAPCSFCQQCALGFCYDITNCECDESATCNNDDPCDGEETCVGHACQQGTSYDCAASTDICFANECYDNAGSADCHLVRTDAVGCEYCDGAGQCDDSNPCTDDACNDDGKCVYVANDSNSCSDDIGCTTDACVSGTCESTEVDSACDDGNQCTDNLCDVINGDATTGCYNPNRTGFCDDGFSCTDPDVCNSGACQGTARDTECNDGNQCTTNLCDITNGDPTTGCTSANRTGSCDDGLACTDPDVCHSGACEGTPRDAECDDGDQCTTNLCDVANGDAVTGCYYPGHTNGCDDGDSCTGNDVCDTFGTCAGDTASMHLKACAGGLLCYGGVCLQQARADVTSLPTVTNPANGSQTCACDWTVADAYYGPPPSPSTAASDFYAMINHEACTGCEHPSFSGIPLTNFYSVYRVTGPTAIAALATTSMRVGRGYQIDDGYVVGTGWGFATGSMDMGASGTFGCLNATGTGWITGGCPASYPSGIGAITGVGAIGAEVIVIGQDTNGTDAHSRFWNGASWTGDRWIEASNCSGNTSIVRSDADRTGVGLGVVPGPGGHAQAMIAATNDAPTAPNYSSEHYDAENVCNNTRYTRFRTDVADVFFDGAIARSNTEVFLWAQDDIVTDRIVTSLYRCTVPVTGSSSWSCSTLPAPLPTTTGDRIDYHDAAITPGGDLLLVATVCLGCNSGVPTLLNVRNRLVALPAGKDGTDPADWEIHALSGGATASCVIPPCIFRLVRAVSADDTQIYILGDNRTNDIPVIWHLDPP